VTGIYGLGIDSPPETLDEREKELKFFDRDQQNGATESISIDVRLDRSKVIG
jgi:hypothetical protein